MWAESCIFLQQLVQLRYVIIIIVIIVSVQYMRNFVDVARSASGPPKLEYQARLLS